MGHNSKIGYPYLPAREPWRGRDVLQRAWRVTLAGPASDPGGDRRSGTRKRSLAGDPGGDAGRPWRGTTLALAKRAWQATLAGTAALVQHDAWEKQNTKPVLVLLRVVVGGFHATKTARPTTTPWVGRAVALRHTLNPKPLNPKPLNPYHCKTPAFLQVDLSLRMREPNTRQELLQQRVLRQARRSFGLGV